MTKHLYIHIPFCSSICKYCDFKRELKSIKINDYLKKVINELKAKANIGQFETIYIGGGTPNCLTNKQLDYLLKNIKLFLSKKYEFTIECNPECITNDQVKIFKKHNVNRISLGIQTTNEKILLMMNRKHTLKDVQNAIEILYKNNIFNISCDFIYGFNELSNKDIQDSISFLIKNNIKHVSFYQLELKENSILTKNGYSINSELSDKHFLSILNLLKKNKYKRYEISNWAISKKYQSKHNLAYWKTDDWMAIGYGGCGFENNEYYENIGTIDSWSKLTTKYSQKDYDQQLLMMGLRLIDGIDLSIKKNKMAYKSFEKIIKNDVILVKNFVKAKHINLLNNLLIKII